MNRNILISVILLVICQLRKWTHVLASHNQRAGSIATLLIDLQGDLMCIVLDLLSLEHLKLPEGSSLLVLTLLLYELQLLVLDLLL